MKPDLRSAGAFVALICSFLLHSCIVPDRPAPTETASQEDIAEPSEAASPTDGDDTGRPASPKLGPPYRFNVDSIVQLVFARSARVTAARQEMIASQYGLEEFRRNLSRLEPFVETRADVSDFPHRSGAFGHQAEAVVGVQKETFEGAILRTEVGGAMSRFEFGGPASTANPLEEGEGVLMRTRFEAPFFGSRRRQNRVIAQAFQESTARKAQLDYLSDYRAYVDDALSYYISIVYHGRLAVAYQSFIDDLEGLLGDARLRQADRARVQSQKSSAEFQRDQYRTDQKESETILLAELRLPADAEFEIEQRTYRLSPFAVEARSPQALEEMIDRARQNNPAFTVLADAIANTELQRDQAINGRYDVTTFLEGTVFPIGSATFDDRLDGWSIGGGLVVRLNDHEVLTATRLKAQAEIRQFRAQIEAEEILMRRRIVMETRGLLDNDEQRKKLLATREEHVALWKRRVEAYFAGDVNIDQLLYVRKELRSTDSELAQNTYSSESRERRLLGALGRIYDVVGLTIGDGLTESDERPLQP